MSNRLEWWQTWSPDLAYVLGFAFADGGIGRERNSLTLAQSDKQILDDIAAIVPGSHFTYLEDQNLWRLRYCEPGLNTLMCTYGIVPNKTELGFWPPNMPASLTRHYIRGYFDGDGHVGFDGKRSTVMFVCHLREYLERLELELRSLGMSSRIPLRDGRNYRLRYTCRDDYFTLYDLFYQDTCLFIKRKRQTFDKVLEHYRNSQGHKGSAHGNAKLTESDVKEIRQLWREGNTQLKIAEMYGVNNRCISMIVNYIAWRHVE